MKHSVSTYLILAITVATQTLSAGSLNAQDSEEERSHERRLRDDARNEQWRKKFNAAEYLKSQDDDKDGVLTPEEMDGRRTKYFLEKMGISTGKSSKIKDLVKNYNARKASETEKKRKEFESRLSNLAKFGAETDSFGVDQFGTEDKSEGLGNFDETATGMKASDFDPEMLEKAKRRLETFDRDGNGFLDGDEISRISWKSPPPEASDLNRDGRLSKMELAKRFTTERTTQKRKAGLDRYDSQKRDRGSSSEASSRSQRGDYSSRDRDRRSRDSGRESHRDGGRNYPNSTSGSAVAKAKANAKSSQGYAKYVDRSFKKYDSNSDGRLDKKELEASSLLKKAKDTDGDGFISKQEAIALVSGGNGKTSAATTTPSKAKPTPRKSTGRRTSASATTPSAGQRKPLSDKDADADGQIQMHEYTDTWTAEKLKEFRKKDTDGDGLLSPAEWRGK